MRKRRTAAAKRSVKRPVSRKRSNPALLFDIIGIALILLCPVMIATLFAPSKSGFLGGFIYDLSIKSVGVGSYLLPVLFLLVGAMLVVGPLQIIRRNIGIGSTSLFFVIITWASLVKQTSDPMSLGGGMWGNLLSSGLRYATGDVISFILLVAVALISIVIIVDVPLVQVIDKIRQAYIERRELVPIVKDKKEKDTKLIEESKKRTIAQLFGRNDANGGNGESDEPEKVELKRPVKIHNGLIHKPERPALTAVAESPIDLSLPVEQGEFMLPSTALLSEPQPPPLRVESELKENIEIIERTLEEFKVQANVVEIACGPTVARYEIQLAPGIKVNRIVGLADNLAMQLAAIDVRVEAPIPGKAAIGVEVPNKNRSVVGIREVIESKAFREAPGKLTFTLGKDVSGNPVIADLAKMPHLLVGGSTNSGKSICLNALIASLCYRATPDELKMILIDPKRVELTMFDDIPHLACPVVKDVKMAAGILRSVVQDMEKRYELLSRTSTKNIETYNEKMSVEERMPYMVVVVDELCDLMMQCAAEVEGSITRIAQLARAVGIHLVIATQRPSVDVITGVIKANISSRVAFAVSSHHDSRTILDQKGAERLIGKGDMLFLPIDANKPSRIQGCYISEKEIVSLTGFLKEQRKPTYSIVPSSIGGPGGHTGDDDETFADEYYEPSVRFVVSTGYCSTSMLQRKFKVGYTRAARIVDAMEMAGIVGALDGAKPRQVLISKSDVEAVLGGQMGFSIDDSSEDDFEDSEEFYEEEEKE